MALLIGLVAAAARTMANHDDNGRQNRNNNGYNNAYNNGQYHDNQSGCSNNYSGGYPNSYNNGYNNGYNNNGYSNGCGSNNYNASPYAAYPPQMMVSRREERRMGRRMRKAERKARDADMVLSLMNSGTRAGRSPLPQYSNMQPQTGNGGVPYMQRGDNSRSQAMYHPAQQGVIDPEPSGSQWRDVQSRDRPTSRGDLHPASSSESLPTYEQVVRKSGRS